MSDPGAPATLFRTSDLLTSTFLVTLGIQLLSIESEGERSVFTFPTEAKFIALKLHQPGEDLVSASAFHANLRRMRGLARGEGHR